MKNLNINQMEGLNGGISNRNCMGLGILAAMSWATGLGGGIAGTMAFLAVCDDN